MFKYEVHIHTSATSKCAVSSAAQMIQSFKENGYDGIVLTNHFYNGNTAVDRKLPWEDFVGAYEYEWLQAKTLGDSLDFDVIFGVEDVYLKGSGKEVLIYGITPEEFKMEKNYKNHGLSEISAFVRKNGGFIAAAHPFRRDSYIADADYIPNPSFLDGAEVYNGSPNFGTRDNRNNLALEFSKNNGLKMTSGGDIHKAFTKFVGLSGIATYERVKDTKHFAKILHSGRYKLIINGRISDTANLTPDSVTV